MGLQVDFYSTDDCRPEAAARLLCKVVEKAYRQGMKVYVHTPSPRRARFFDELLWTFRQGSFVPHEICDGSGQGQAPVRIGSGGVQRGDASLLCNLSPEVPPTLDGFERLVDVADGAEPGLSAGRARFRWYKGQGMSLAHHPMPSSVGNDLVRGTVR